MKHITSLTIAGLLLSAASSQAAAIAHWSFDTNGNDSVGTNNLTASAASVSFANSGGAFGGFMNDTNANASADLTSDIVLLASIVTDTDGWGVSFWLNNWDYNDMVMGNKDTANSDSALFTRGSDADPRIQIRDIGPAANITATGANVDRSDNWTHFAMVREADGTMTVYVDGVGYVELDGGGNPTGNTQQLDFTINALGAATASGTNFIGNLDEVWIFDSALTTTQVNSLMTNNNIIPEPSTALLSALGLLALLRRRR